jgi:hypothetical protein
MGRRIPVVPESQIVDDFVEKKKPGRRGVRVSRAPSITSVDTRAPANPWVPPEGHEVKPLVDDSGVSEIHFADNPPKKEPWPKDWPPYALDGPPSQRPR